MYRIKLIAAVCVTGIVAGAVGVLLGVCIQFFASVFFGVGSGENFTDAVLSLPVWLRVLLPAFGGLLVGVLLYVARAPEVAGEGVPAIQRALRDDSVIRYRTAPLKFLATTVTLGTGGSAGREGPIIQIGGGIGMSVARLLQIAGLDRPLLLLAGVAGAMAAAFGTPAAALVFVVEVLRRKIDYRGVVLLVASTVIASVVARMGFGYVGLSLPAVSVTPFVVSDVPAFVILGLGAGLIAVIFTRLLRLAHVGFEWLAPSLLVRPALGGLMVGLLALFSPFIHEPGMMSLLSGVSAGNYTITFLVILVVLKIIATVVTVGSGGSGGIFAPSLFLGFVWGGILIAVGSVFGVTVPFVVLYVGMAAVFAAAAHAPLTAMFIIYELVGTTDIIVPLLIATVVSYGVARYILPYSMYSVHDNT